MLLDVPWIALNMGTEKARRHCLSIAAQILWNSFSMKIRLALSLLVLHKLLKTEFFRDSSLIRVVAILFPTHCFNCIFVKDSFYIVDFFKHMGCWQWIAMAYNYDRWINNKLMFFLHLLRITIKLRGNGKFWMVELLKWLSLTLGSDASSLTALMTSH